MAPLVTQSPTAFRIAPALRPSRSPAAPWAAPPPRWNRPERAPVRSPRSFEMPPPPESWAECMAIAAYGYRPYGYRPDGERPDSQRAGGEHVHQWTFVPAWKKKLTRAGAAPISSAARAETRTALLPEYDWW